MNFAEMQMNWDDLRFFRAVAETTTLAGAARRLSVNHSTVFRRINRFEKHLGTRLFERLPDGYQLTDAGEVVLNHVSRIGEEVDNIQIKLLGKDYRPSGKIRLTAPDNLAYAYLPRYLVDFTKRYPEIDIDMVVGAENLNLTRREADIAIRLVSAAHGNRWGFPKPEVRAAWEGAGAEMLVTGDEGAIEVVLGRGRPIVRLQRRIRPHYWNAGLDSLPGTGPGTAL